MMIDISSVMVNLAAKRPVFHSEADFQHAFAWELHELYPEALIRLEKPIRSSEKNGRLDVVLTLGGKPFVVELKYKTKGISFALGDELFNLANHSANDQGRYDFIKDVCRIEEIARDVPGCSGVAVMLTNDAGYWKPSRGSDTADAAFRLTDGRILTGQLAWSQFASAGTQKNRVKELAVQGQYRLAWQPFSSPPVEKVGAFRYLAVHVPASA